MSTELQPVSLTPQQEEEIALVAAARSGDITAFETLVRRYERRVLRVAQQVLGQSEDAEDVLQETFLKAFSKLDQFRGQSRFYTWLVRIALNEALMRLRKRRPEQVSLDEELPTDDGFVPRDFSDWRPNPEQLYERTEMQQILGRAITSLSLPYRLVFQLRDVEGLSTEETAEALNLSVPAVKSRLLRARLQLRERLARHFRSVASPGAEGVPS